MNRQDINQYMNPHSNNEEIINALQKLIPEEKIERIQQLAKTKRTWAVQLFFLIFLLLAAVVLSIFSGQINGIVILFWVILAAILICHLIMRKRDTTPVDLFKIKSSVVLPVKDQTDDGTICLSPDLTKEALLPLGSYLVDRNSRYKTRELEVGGYLNNPTFIMREPLPVKKHTFYSFHQKKAENSGKGE